MIKRSSFCLFILLFGLPLQSTTPNAKDEPARRWPWQYTSVAEFISEQFIRPQFKRIKEKELPEIMETVNIEAEKRVPKLVDKGLGHLASTLKPYGIGGLIVTGSIVGGLWIYNHVVNTGLAGLVRRFEKYDHSINADIKILDTQLIALKRKKSEKDTDNLQTLKNLLEGYQKKVQTALESIEKFETPITN
jgi:hypothetical protein